MSTIRLKYDEDFKKNAVQLKHASPKSVRQVTLDLGIAKCSVPIADAIIYRSGEDTLYCGTLPYFQVFVMTRFSGGREGRIEHKMIS